MLVLILVICVAGLVNKQCQILTLSSVVDDPIIEDVERLPKPEPMVVLPVVVESGYNRDILLADELARFIKLRKSNTPKSIAREISITLIKSADMYDLPLGLIVGIVEIESVWNPYAKSHLGAVGLMQIYDGGPEIRIDKKLAWDIDYNIDKGCEILREHIRIHEGDIYKALLGYSGGKEGYPERVYTAMGRYASNTWRYDSPSSVSLLVQ